MKAVNESLAGVDATNCVKLIRGEVAGQVDILIKFVHCELVSISLGEYGFLQQACSTKRHFCVSPDSNDENNISLSENLIAREENDFAK